MVLLKYNRVDCTDNRELFYHLLNMVRGAGRCKEDFTYPLFCKYVININIEMLKEIMFLASGQGRT